jgi:hypothetical protein
MRFRHSLTAAPRPLVVRPEPAPRAVARSTVAILRHNAAAGAVHA